MAVCFGCMSEIGDSDRCPHCGFTMKDYEIQPHQLMPGSILHERYVVGKILGEGGFGITYVGADGMLGTRVAIKEFYMTGFVNRNNSVSNSVVPETGSKKEQFEKNKERFYREARTVAKFGNTEGIVNVSDFFYENNTAYLIMEFLEGVTLKEYLKKSGNLSVEETLEIFGPIMIALKKVHSENFIHRDISPDNLFITYKNGVKLIDFGAAREFAENDVKSLSVILKPGFAPMEQYRSKGVQGPWTDIYALCATIYHCLSGVTPEESLERFYEDNVKGLSDINPDVPKCLSDVVMKGLAVRQENRYQSIEEMFEDLRKCTLPGKAGVLLQDMLSPEGPKNHFNPLNGKKQSSTEEIKSLGTVNQAAINALTQQKDSDSTVLPAKNIPEKKSKKGLIIGIACGAAALVAGIVLAIIFLFGNRNKGVEDSSAQKMAENGSQPVEETSIVDNSENSEVADSDELTDEGDIITIYCYDDEIAMVLKYLPGFTYSLGDFQHQTGEYNGKSVQFKVFEDISSAGHQAYFSYVTDEIEKGNDVDLFVLTDSDFNGSTPMYEDYADSMEDLGISSWDLSDQYDYTLEKTTADDGKVYGLSYDVCPCGVIYNRNIAKKVLGTDDPDEVQKMISDWDKWMDVAGKMKKAGYLMTPSISFLEAKGADAALVEEMINKGYTENVKISDNDGSFYFEDTAFCTIGPQWYIDFGMRGSWYDSIAYEGGWGLCIGPENSFCTWGESWLFVSDKSDNKKSAVDLLRALTLDENCMSAADDYGFVPNNKQLLFKYMLDTKQSHAYLGGQNPYIVWYDILDKYDYLYK
ncbi:MAG: extracellular solute-binding protein [Lachnospiraceae bacterium]|nr:extracellular solute-binding protein [Lachnospiraceae bacterium]